MVDVDPVVRLLDNNGAVPAARDGSTDLGETTDIMPGAVDDLIQFDGFAGVVSGDGRCGCDFVVRYRGDGVFYVIRCLRGCGAQEDVALTPSCSDARCGERVVCLGKGDVRSGEILKQFLEFL